MAVGALVAALALAGCTRGGQQPEDDTDVGGLVIERTEDDAGASETAASPSPDDDVALAEPTDEPTADPPAGNGSDDDALDPGGAPDPPAPAADSDPGPAPRPRPRPEPQPQPEPEPEPEPTREPEPEPEPTRPPPPPPETLPAEPSPSPSDGRVALQEGEGHSRNTAYAEDGQWSVSEVHGAPDDDSAAARDRMYVEFDQAGYKQGSEVVTLQCDGVVRAGSQALFTDDEAHVFEVELVRLDANGTPAGVVATAVERHAYELEPGQSTIDAPVSTEPVQVAAADDVDYTCAFRYRTD